MDQEVEEVSFLPGEVILNKKAVYEPTKGQRFRQIVCSRAWAMGILLFIGTVMVAIAVIAAFARPASSSVSSHCPSQEQEIPIDAGGDINAHEVPQTYTATNGEPFPWKNLRLPETIVPETYNIFYHANISESYFIGKIHMILRVVQETDFIIFHSKELNISDVKVSVGEGVNASNLNSAKGIEVVKVLEYPRNEQVYLQVSNLLHTGHVVHVQVDFRGSLKDVSKLRGFYKSSYTMYGQKRYIASTQFEATAARMAFPCLDEPSLKAKFSMSMVREKQHITLFNTLLKKTGPFSGDLVIDEYEETVKMSTYLVAFVVCDYKYISATTESGVQVRVFAPEDKISMGFLALNATVKLLDFYTYFFGTPYPLQKQDLIAIPNFGAGAMENWGLITFRETGLLYDPGVSTSSAKLHVISTVAHELAHQWFGNLVTMKWWNDLWLNEGFASFVENEIGTDTVDSTLRKRDQAMSDFYDAMSLDSLSSSHPIALAVNDPNEIESLFDGVSYRKGSAVIRMLKGFLKDGAFKTGLRNYLQKHKFGNADTGDLWEAFYEVANMSQGTTVSDVMDTWTKQMGYPVVTVTREEGNIHLSQQRFQIYGHSDDDVAAKGKNSASPYGYKWIIPFTYTSSSDRGEQTLFWLSDERSQLRLHDDSVKWIKGNVDTQGFYRVNYDEGSWKAIIQQLREDHTVFTVADRIGLVEDVFSLARAGLTDYKIALDLISYLVNETDFFVWSSAFSHITFLMSRLYLEEEYEHLENYILSLSKPHIDRAEWDKQSDPVMEYMQSLMIGLACRLHYGKVKDEAVRKFEEWKTTKEIKVSNGLRSLIISQGVKYGLKSDWDLVFERYKNEKVPSERHILLAALAATSETRVLQILLEYSMDGSKVSSQDVTSVIANVAGKHNGHLLAWRFFRMHYDWLYERFGHGAFLLADVITDVVAPFKTQFDYDEVVTFFKNKDVGPAKLSLKQALEYIQSHIIWSNKHLATVKTLLQDINRAKTALN